MTKLRKEIQIAFDAAVDWLTGQVSSSSSANNSQSILPPSPESHDTRGTHTWKFRRG